MVVLEYPKKLIYICSFAYQVQIMIAEIFHREALFAVANDIDKRVSSVNSKATVLVGLSRVGKSTSYNWILRHPLLAVKEEVKEAPNEEAKEEQEGASSKRQRGARANRARPTQGLRVVFVPQVIRSETAEVKPGYKSCTLVPNIVPRDNNTTSLIDMQGFGETRDYVGTLAVSYSLKAIFEAVDQIRFILVIAESDLLDNSGQSLCKSLGHFLGLFDLSGSVLKEKIFKSTALLVTQSQSPEQHRKLIDNVINNLDDNKIENIKNREAMIDLLDHLYEYNRIDRFAIAKLAQQPQPCTILEHYATKDWEYLRLKELPPLSWEQLRLKELPPLSFIKLPFENEYQKMKADDQDSFKRAIASRLQSYKHFATIFTDMFAKLLVAGSIHKIKLPYDHFFRQIDKFIAENDHYDCRNEVRAEELRALEFRKPQREMLLRHIMDLQRILYIQGDFFTKSKEEMSDIFVRVINEFIQFLLTIFCRNQVDAIRILQVRYILMRGVRESYMLYKVREDQVSASFNNIYDALQGILPQDFPLNLQKFVNSFDLASSERIVFGPKNPANAMEAYFSSRENAYALEILFKLYAQKKALMSSEAKDQYYQMMRDTKMVQAKHELERGQIRESCEYLLQAYRLEMQYEENCLRRVQYDLDRTVRNRLVQEMFVNQENLLDMLKENLVKLGKLSEALQVAREMGWVHSACQIYELRLREELSRQQRYALIRDYAEFCLAHSRKERGIMLLQQLQELQRSSFSKKREINKLIQQSIEATSQFQENYIEFLENKQNIDLFKPERKTLIAQIERALCDSSEIYDLIRISKKFVNEGTRAEYLQEECKAILKIYLEERLKNETVVAQNGFKVAYISSTASEYIPNPKTQQLCATIKMTNIVELDQITNNLITLLEREAKRLDPDKEKVFTIDLEKMTKRYQEISEKHMIITLSNQLIRPTYEYAIKIMKRVRKMALEPFERLLSLINRAVSAVQAQNQATQEQIIARFYAKKYIDNQLRNSSEVDNQERLMKSRDSADDNRQQTRKIMLLVHQYPQATTETIVDKFFKEEKASGMIRSGLAQMVDIIREKNKVDLAKDVADDFEALNETINTTENTFII